MIRRVIEEIKTKYIYVFLIVIYICILVGIASYELMYSNKHVSLSVNNKELELRNGLIDDTYISPKKLLVELSTVVYC